MCSVWNMMCGDWQVLLWSCNDSCGGLVFTYVMFFGLLSNYAHTNYYMCVVCVCVFFFLCVCVCVCVACVAVSVLMKSQKSRW